MPPWHPSLVASLADLAYVFDQQNPAGFTLGGIGLQSDFLNEETKTQTDRLGRNFSERLMPSLIGQQGARGAWNTSATRRKVSNLAQDTGDNLNDIASRASQAQAGLAVNALFAQTGVQV